jgi:hypothetical protein|nr:MAG TPA: hypothetical protein [Caudoviricetes sp.]
MTLTHKILVFTIVPVLVGTIISITLANIHHSQTRATEVQDIAHCLSDDGALPDGEDVCVWDPAVDGDGTGESFVMTRVQYEADQDAREHQAFEAHVIGQDDEKIQQHDAEMQ